MSAFCFPKAARLLKREEFLGLQQRGNSFFGKYLIFNWKKSIKTLPRLGVTVTKKFGPAVSRNRFKRLVREAYRQEAMQLMLPIDCNVRPKYHKKELTLSDVVSDFLLFIRTTDIAR